MFYNMNQDIDEYNEGWSFALRLRLIILNRPITESVSDRNNKVYGNRGRGSRLQ